MCGGQHNAETLPGAPFTLMVCPLMPEDRWALVQDRIDTPQPDVVITPTALAAKARAIQAEVAPLMPWETLFK